MIETPPPLPQTQEQEPIVTAPVLERQGFGLPMQLVIAGILLIAIAASVEQKWLPTQPWSSTLLVLDDEDDPPPGAYYVDAYEVQSADPPEIEEMRGVITKLGGADFAKQFFTKPLAMFVEMPPEKAAPLLASGRLPRPGMHEALAGDLVPEGTIKIADEVYEIVGRLRSSVNGFTYAYMIIENPDAVSLLPDYSEHPGWLVPEGYERIEEFKSWIGVNKSDKKRPETDVSPDGGNGSEPSPRMDNKKRRPGPVDPADGEEVRQYAARPIRHLTGMPACVIALNAAHVKLAQDIEGTGEKTDGTQAEIGTSEASKKAQGPKVFTRQVRVPWFIFSLVFGGLVLVATGGSITSTRLVKLFASQPGHNILGPLLSEVLYRPRLWIGLHIFLYGVLFYTMLEAAMVPVINFYVVNYVSNVFSGGELDYIGKAYASGNVLTAALATFQNNYITQTLLLTFVPSLPGIPFGLVKTVGSFVLAGAAMSPLWTDTASSYVFHSFTMVIELEAYIIASFAVVAWPMRLIRALARSNVPLEEIMRGIRVMTGAMLVTGYILAFAALYEAATLIGFMMR